jgi:hypothetical protein
MAFTPVFDGLCPAMTESKDLLGRLAGGGLRFANPPYALI